MSTDNLDNPIPASQPPSTDDDIRKLAAIMFTDIKDFSKKMQSDEVATIHMLKIHNEMMTATITKHRGQVIKTIGDAFLVSFESVVSATQCAIEAQQSFHKYNQTKPTPEKITVRIGVHLGDVFVRDNDVFGDGVNIASRIQSMAEPGGVNISNSVYDQVKNKLDIHVINLGAPQLKNIKEAIKVYQVIIIPTDKSRGKLSTQIYVTKTILKRKRTQHFLAATAITFSVITVAWFYFFQGSHLSASDKSIALLPFVNIGDPESEYLADGLTEDIIAQLSKLPQLLVISRTSSFNYKASKLSDSLIATELGVRFLLKGTIQLTPLNAKLRASLIDARIGREAWDESYDRSRDSIFEIESQVTKRIADYFRLEFDPTWPEFQKSSPSAYEEYLRGLFHARKLTRDDNALAMKNFSESLEKDPGFVKALISLADAQVVHYDYGWDRSEKLLIDAEGLCEKALSLDSMNASAIATLGTIKMFRGDQKQGTEFLEYALKINPHNLIALYRLANAYLFTLNDPAKAVQLFNKFQEVEPTSWGVMSNLAVGYAQLKNYPEAIKAFQRSIQINPKQFYAWNNLGYVYERISNYDSAIQCYLAAIKIEPTNTLPYESLTTVLLGIKNFSLAESVLSSGIKLMENNHELIYNLGVTNTFSGKRDQARQTFLEGLKLLEHKIKKDPTIGDNYAYKGLYEARLGNIDSAIVAADAAMKLDSTNNEVVMKVARIYAVLGKKEMMLEWFKRARRMNPEFDAAYLTTAVDFEKFRNDTDLRLMAREE